MRRRIMSIICVTMALFCITGCGNNKAEQTVVNDKPTVTAKKEEPDSTNIETEDKVTDQKPSPEKTDATEPSSERLLDAAYFEEYDRQYVQSETYNPVFENRCFYIDGVRVHMPDRVGDLEELFNTHFVDALHLSGDSRVLLVDEKDEGIAIEYDKSELPDETFHSFAGDFSPEYEESLQKLMQTHIITLYMREDKDTHGVNGIQYPDILKKYNVTYEEVDDNLNDYGYRLHISNIYDYPELFYKYADEEVYVFYKLLLGDVPPAVELIANIPFAVYKEDDFTFIGGYEFGLNDFLPEDGTCYLYAKNTDDGSEYAFDYDYQNRQLIEVDPEQAYTYTEDYDEILEHLSKVDGAIHLAKCVGK